MAELNDYAASPPYYNPEAPPKYSSDPRPPMTNRGYQKLPTSDYPPASAPPHPGYYAPMPPAVQQQQSSNTNVVVVGQPQSQPQQVVSIRIQHANTYMALSIILTVICLFHGNFPPLVCLIPALICSFMASDHNNAGEYEAAKSCGGYSLFCNLCSIIYFVIVLLAGIAFMIVFFTVGFGIFKKTISDNSNVCYGNHAQSCGFDNFNNWVCC